MNRLSDLFAGLPGGLDRFLEDGPVNHPRFQLLAADLRRLSTFGTADNARVRGLIDRVSGHFLTATGKCRQAERIHPYGKEDYAHAAAGKRHREAALSLSRPVEDIVRAFARDLNGSWLEVFVGCLRSRSPNTGSRSTSDRSWISRTCCSAPWIC